MNYASEKFFQRTLLGKTNLNLLVGDTGIGDPFLAGDT
jgi:hypothetical protein